MKIIYANTGGVGLLQNYKSGDLYQVDRKTYDSMQLRYDFVFHLCLYERATKRWFADCILQTSTENNNDCVRKSHLDFVTKYYILLGEEITAKNELDFFQKRAEMLALSEKADLPL